MDIYARTGAILRAYQFPVRKKYGQNFLIDGNMLMKIADAADLCHEDTVLEIGPGIGSLTEFLARRAGRVIAVEIDPFLIPILGDTLSPYENVEVIEGDILDVLPQITADKVVANLPYYITTPVISRLLEETDITSMVLLMQTEVADRIEASPGSREYGALSLLVQYHAAVKRVGKIPKECFLPRPHVDSTILTITRYAERPAQAADEAHLFHVIRASFNQRRKTLVNGLSAYAPLGLTKDAVLAAIRQMGLPDNIRGEALSVAQFVLLSDILSR